MSTYTTCATCGQLVEQPANASPAVSVARPATHYCPVCGRQYPEDGSCDYGHPNVPSLMPIEDAAPEAPVEPAPSTEAVLVGATVDANRITFVPPPAEPVYGAGGGYGNVPAEPAPVEPPALAPSQPEPEPEAAQGPSQPEPDPNAVETVEGVNTGPAPEGSPHVEPCPTCHGNRTVPAPPPAGEVICPTCSGTGNAPDPVQ